MKQIIRHRLHVLEAADWKDGVITLLEPGSPYRPWRYAFGETRPGDYAILVLGTDPTSVLTVLARVDQEGGLGGAMLDLTRYDTDLVDLTTLAMMLDTPGAFDRWRLDDDDAERMILALHESRVHGRPFYRWGHSEVAAARNLLRFKGNCDGCGDEIDLSGADARDQVHIHTVAPLLRPNSDSPVRTVGQPTRARSHWAWLRSSARDWPAVICRRCQARMSTGNFSSFVDFKFDQNPDCSQCGSQRTQMIGYGMPVDPESWGPWLHIGGCGVDREKWHCGVCDHEWY